MTVVFFGRTTAVLLESSALDDKDVSKCFGGKVYVRAPPEHAVLNYLVTRPVQCLKK